LREPLIGETDPKIPDPPPSPYIWFALFGLAGFMGTKIPELIPELATVDPFLGAILAMIGMIGVYHFFGKPKDEKAKAVLE